MRGAIPSRAIRTAIVSFCTVPAVCGARCGIHTPETIDDVFRQLGRDSCLHKAAVKNGTQEHIQRHFQIDIGPEFALLDRFAQQSPSCVRGPSAMRARNAFAKAALPAA